MLHFQQNLSCFHNGQLCSGIRYCVILKMNAEWPQQEGIISTKVFDSVSFNTTLSNPFSLFILIVNMQDNIECKFLIWQLAGLLIADTNNLYKVVIYSMVLCRLV